MHSYAVAQTRFFMNHSIEYPENINCEHNSLAKQNSITIPHPLRHQPFSANELSTPKRKSQTRFYTMYLLLTAIHIAIPFANPKISCKYRLTFSASLSIAVLLFQPAVDSDP